MRPSGMSKEFREGYEAAKDENARTEDCPYDMFFEPKKYASWLMGFSWEDDEQAAEQSL